jgi:hypothetical protein
MRTKPIAVGLFIVAAAAACSASNDDVGSSTDALVACSIPNKQQADGSQCQWDNCGTTSAAMMREAMTCGAENHSGGTMRTYYADYINKPGTCLDYAGGKPGTIPANIGGLMEHISSYDHGTNYASTTTYYSSISLASIESYLSQGYVAVIAGGTDDKTPAPCGFKGGHSIFVHHYDKSTDKFLVYDPCCSAACAGSDYNGKSSPQWWPASSLNAWDVPGVTIGKGAAPPTKCGTTTCPAGDFCGPENKCCNPNTCSPGCPC